MRCHRIRAILILGAGKDQLPAFYAARRLGLRVVAIDPSSSAEGARLADCFYTHDLADFEACVSVARKDAVDGVMTLAADYPIPAVAEVCEALGLPGLSKPTALRCTNKAEMRRALAKAGIPGPRFSPASSLEEAIMAARETGAPMILKPVDSSGGRGVTCIEAPLSPNDIREAFDRALHFSRARQVLVEQVVDGDEFSVEALTHEGQTRIIAVTDKLTTESPFFVEIGHSQPSRLSARDVSEVGELAVRVLEALGIDNSPSHTEIRRGSSGFRVIEVGARLGGGCIASHLVPISTGIDLVQAAMRLALGEAPDPRQTRARGAAIRFFTPRPGRVRSVNGCKEARRAPGVRVVAVNAGVGHYIPPLLRDAGGRTGYVICEANDALAAVRNAEKACEMVSFETEEESTDSPERQ